MSYTANLSTGVGSVVETRKKINKTLAYELVTNTVQISTSDFTAMQLQNCHNPKL